MRPKELTIRGLILGPLDLSLNAGLRFTSWLAPAILLLTGCTRATQSGVAPSADSAAYVRAVADQYVQAFAQQFPERSTVDLGPPHSIDDRLSDNSLAALEQWQRREDAWLTELTRIHPASLVGRAEWVIHGLLLEELQSSRAARVCRQELWPVSQQNVGWQVRLAILAATQPLGSAPAREAALERLGQLPGYLDVEVANLREGLRLGYSTPRRNVQLVISELDSLLAKPVEQWPFFELARRDSSAELRRRLTALLSDSLRPAILRYRDFLASEYRPAARESIALSAHPSGAACYRALLRRSTTLDLDPREVADLAERDMRERAAKAVRLSTAVYGETLTFDSLRARFRNDRRARGMTPERMLALSDSALTRARRVAAEWFSRLPSHDVIVQPAPDERARIMSSPGSYSPPAAGSGSPGIFWLNLRRAPRVTPGAVERLAFHEGIPGHHLQFGVARGGSVSHPIVRILRNGGLVEGWAKYAEELADEMGLYSSDLARLDLYFSSFPSLEVDPGVHALGWTRERADSFYRASFLNPGGAAGEASEAQARMTDRVAVTPAQTTSYGVGYFELVSLRRRAERALGPRFDVREFHTQVLEDGVITLPMLRAKIDRWIAAVSGQVQAR